MFLLHENYSKHRAMRGLIARLKLFFSAFWGGAVQRMTVSLRHGLAIAAIGIFIGIVVAYAALASFGAVELLFAQWRPDADLLTVGFRGLHLSWLLIPILAGLAIGGLLSWLAPQPPVELADVIHAAHKPDPQVSRTGGYVSLLKSVLALGGGSPTGLYGPLVVLGGQPCRQYETLYPPVAAFWRNGIGGRCGGGHFSRFRRPIGRYFVRP